MHRALRIDSLTHVQNILQPSFVGPFNVVGPAHLPTIVLVPWSGRVITQRCDVVGYWPVLHCPVARFQRPVMFCVNQTVADANAGYTSLHNALFARRRPTRVFAPCARFINAPHNSHKTRQRSRCRHGSSVYVTYVILWNVRVHLTYAYILPYTLNLRVTELLWPPCVADADIIFLPRGFYLLFIFFYSSPNLSGRRLDVYHTSTHDVAL